MDASKQSLDSDNRHLLDPSRPSSIYSFATTTTTTNRADDATPTQSTTHLPSGSPAQQASNTNTPYRGFPSKEAYLQALTAFGQERQYFKADNGLVGFYDSRTMDDYIKDGRGGVGRSRAKKVGGDSAAAAARRSTLPEVYPGGETEGEGQRGVQQSAAAAAAAGGRRASLAQLGRRVLGRQSVA